MTIPIPQRIDNKLSEFYPLQREELIKLREVKLINNAAYVHLALRYENPFCDRPVQIIPKEFALRWRIPESSVYSAIAKLKDLGILNIKSGKLVIDWITSESQESKKGTERRLLGKKILSQNATKDTEEILKSDKPVSDNNYQIEEKIIRSEKKLSDPRIDYQIQENHGLKPLSDIGSSISQTLQTIQTNQTRGGREKVFSPNQESNEQESVQEIVQKQEINEEKKLVSKSESVEQSTRDVAQKKSEIITDGGKSSADIPNDLREKLEELEIPLDERVRNAIASHHISRAYGAAVHVENTWDTVNNPRSVFLYQLPKQPIEKLGSRYSEEILNNMKAQNLAIEEERKNPEYHEKVEEAFAQIRAKLEEKRAQ